MYNAHLFNRIVASRPLPALRPSSGQVGASGDPYWPQDMPWMKARYMNGRRADDLFLASSPWPPDSRIWTPDDWKLAWNVALREQYRQLGAPKTADEKRRRDDMVTALINAEQNSEWHVFSSRPSSENIDWRRWACFAHWYWFLSPSAREELRNDMVNYAALWRWAPVAIDQNQPKCPVFNDPAYKSTTSVFLASNDWTDLYSLPPGIKGLTGEQAFPWPVVDLMGNPALPAWLPLPGPCSPFPQCLGSVWPAWLPVLPVDQLWAQLGAWVAQNPTQLRMLRGPDGGIYTPTEAPVARPPSPPVNGQPPGPGGQPVGVVPANPPPEQRISPFVEKHTNDNGACRWHCSVDSVNQATDMQTCREYADCQIRNDPMHANADVSALTNQCITALGGNGVGWFLQSSGPETCKEVAPAPAPTWWSENWKYVAGGGLALVGLISVGLLLRKPAPRAFGAVSAEEGVSSRVRRGTRVRFGPSPASLALYTSPPPTGSTGTVVAIPVGSKSVTFLPGPGGGLVYVDWDGFGVMGTAPQDLWAVKRGSAGEHLVPADVGERIVPADVGEYLVPADVGEGRKQIPKGQIEWLVGNMHVGVPDDEVRADIEARARKAGASASFAKACGNYAVTVHHRNQKLYNDVMGGRLREEARRSSRSKTKPKCPCTPAEPVDPAYRQHIEELAWAKTHRDFRGKVKGVRYMLYLNPQSGGTELWPLSAVPLSHLEWIAGVRRDIART